MFEGPVQDLIDELGKLPGIGPEERAAHRVPPALGRAAGHRPADRGAGAGARRGAVLRGVRQRLRRRALPDLQRRRAATARWCVWSRSPRTCRPSSAPGSSAAATTCWAVRWIRCPGIGPEQLRIRQLLNRIGERVDGVDITEVIIATDPNTEGEATATYLVRMLRDIPGLTVTPDRLGSADGRRPRVRRRADAGPRAVRPPRDGLDGASAPPFAQTDKRPGKCE